MRNLKKVLAMVLALVMSLSLVTVANAAIDFDDVDTIEHKEAVDVMTAIGVIEGFEDGSYDPDGTLTREQAAKMIAYMLLGDKAEALGAMDTGFKDVASTRWSAPYIAYCVSLGIIDGAGDGNFYPAGKLTGYAFAKMLLCALGYGVKDEYVGVNWMLNVARDGVQIGLYKNCDVSDQPISRDDAAQLGFNALRSSLVSWSELFGTYSAYTMNYGKQELLGTLAENVFKLSTTIKVDGYGFNTRAWKQDNKVVTDYYVCDEIIDTITDATVAKGTLYKDYTWESVAERYENGAALANLTTASWKTDTTKAIVNGETLYLVDSDEDGEIDKMISVKEYLAKVTKVNAETATADRSVNFTVYTPDGEKNLNKVETEAFEVDQYILVVPNDGEGTASNRNFQYPLNMKAATSDTGAVSAFYKNDAAKSNGYVTLNGTKYAYNWIFSDTDALGHDYTDEYSLNEGSYTAYLDSNGYVIGVVEVESAIKDYAYIIMKGESAFEKQNTAMVALSDGTIKTYNISDKSSKYIFEGISDAKGSSDAQVGRIFGYSINSNNEIVLTDFSSNARYTQVSSAAPNATDKYDNAGFHNDPINSTTSTYGVIGANGFTKGYSMIKYFNDSAAANTDGTAAQYVYATDETVFLYVVNGSVKGYYVGKDNAPSITTAKSASIVTRNSKSDGTGVNYAEFVVVTANPEVTFSKNYIYNLNSTWVGYSKVGDDLIFYYDVILDGEKTRIAVDEGSKNLPMTADTLYNYNYDETKFNGDTNYDVKAGVYSLNAMSAGNYASLSNIFINPNSNVIVGTAGAAGTQYLYHDAKIVDITDKNNVISNATLKAGMDVTVVYDVENGLRIAKTIYITDNHEDDTTPGGGLGVADGSVEGGYFTASNAMTVVDQYNNGSSAEDLIKKTAEAAGYKVNLISGTGASRTVFAQAPDGQIVSIAVTIQTAYKMTYQCADPNWNFSNLPTWVISGQTYTVSASHTAWGSGSRTFSFAGGFTASQSATPTSTAATFTITPTVGGTGGIVTITVA